MRAGPTGTFQESARPKTSQWYGSVRPEQADRSHIDIGIVNSAGSIIW